MKPYLKCSAAIGCLYLLTGCATIIKGTSQDILVSTPPTTHASCTLSNGEGNWVVSTPGRVRVSKSKEDILIRCTKPGYQDVNGTIPSDFQGWTLGNLLLSTFCLIGFGVDAATGAINEYPRTYQLPMGSDYPDYRGSTDYPPESGSPYYPPDSRSPNYPSSERSSPYYQPQGSPPPRNSRGVPDKQGGNDQYPGTLPPS